MQNLQSSSQYYFLPSTPKQRWDFKQVKASLDAEASTEPGEIRTAKEKLKVVL